MRFVDPYSATDKQTNTIVFAAHDLHGATLTDNWDHFTDECFVLSDGGTSLKHAHIASKLACETAVWGYKHIRQHRYYRLDKKLFMRRIFRSTNLAIWQKRREKGFEEGLSTTLLVLMTGTRSFWLGNIGNSSAWIFKNGKIEKLTRDDVDTNGKLTKATGFKRLGLLPMYVTGKFEVGDVILLLSDGAADFLLEKDMLACVTLEDQQPESLKKAVLNLLECAKANGSRDDMTAILITRVAI